MYTNIEIIEAIKYSGLVAFNKGDEKAFYKKIYAYEDSYEEQYNYNN